MVNLATGTDVLSRLGRVENAHNALVEQTDNARREAIGRLERIEEMLFGSASDSNPYQSTESLMIGEQPKATEAPEEVAFRPIERR